MNRIKINTLLAVMLTAATLFGDDAANQFTTAKTAFDNKQYEAARAGFDAFLTRFPTNSQANSATFYLAESLIFLNRYAQAETYYNRLVVLGLNDQYGKAALFRLADIPYIQGQFDIAKPRLEEFVEKLPHDANLQFVLHYLGDIAMRKNIPDEAEWYFGQADRMFPEGAKNLESKLGLAWAKNKLGKQSESNAIYQQLMNSTNPAVVEQATYQWGAALLERGLFQEAVTALTDFQRRYPTSAYYADSQRVIARYKVKSNDFDGALQVLAQIAQPSTDDKLMKVRCLYGLKRIAESNTALLEAERTAGTAYRDEIALLKSSFLFDQRDWKGTIALLESVLVPQFDPNTNRMILNYTSLPMTGINKLSDEALFRAYSLLTLAYSQNGESAKAAALFNEMEGQAALSGNTALITICTGTSNQLASIGTVPRGGGYGQSSFGGRGKGQQGGQWTPSQNSGSNANTLPTLTSGTDLEKFWRAMQLYQAKNYAGAVQQFELILSGQYNQLIMPKQYVIIYNITGAAGTLDENTFAKACSLLALSKAQLGDFEQANAVLSTFASRIRLTDSVQKNLLQETQEQLTLLTKNGGATGAASLLSESEQKRLIREANSLYKSQKYDQTNMRLQELIAQNPIESVLAEALLLQSKALYKLGRDHDGITILERIKDSFDSLPQCADALWYLGLYYDSCGNTFKAVEYFQTLSEKFPNFRHIDGALYFLALDDLTNSNGRKAATYLTRIYRNYQNGTYWTHAVWTLAYESYKKKEYNQAELYVQKVLSHPPDLAVLDKALYLKGELALRKQEYETAFLAFREVGKLCPESPLCVYATRNAQVAAGKTIRVN